MEYFRRTIFVYSRYTYLDSFVAILQVRSENDAEKWLDIECGSNIFGLVEHFGLLYTRTRSRGGGGL